VTNGTNRLEEVLAQVRLHRRLRTNPELSVQQLSQLLWAAYGCTPHMTASSRAGLTVPSWMAEYFQTNRIYVVKDRVYRYCNRAGSNLATRDHRLELVYDARTLEGCICGPQIIPGPDCAAADLDADGDVDLADFGEFQRDY
jgi:hypothetical protein